MCQAAVIGSLRRQIALLPLCSVFSPRSADLGDPSAQPARLGEALGSSWLCAGLPFVQHHVQAGVRWQPAKADTMTATIFAFRACARHGDGHLCHGKCMTNRETWQNSS